MKKHSLFLAFYLLPLFGQFLYAPLLFAETTPEKIEIKQAVLTQSIIISPKGEAIDKYVGIITYIDLDALVNKKKKI